MLLLSIIVVIKKPWSLKLVPFGHQIWQWKSPKDFPKCIIHGFMGHQSQAFLGRSNTLQCPHMACIAAIQNSSMNFSIKTSMVRFPNGSRWHSMVQQKTEVSVSGSSGSLATMSGASTAMHCLHGREGELGEVDPCWAQLWPSNRMDNEVQKTTGTLCPGIVRQNHVGYVQAYKLDWLLDV